MNLKNKISDIKLEISNTIKSRSRYYYRTITWGVRINNNIDKICDSIEEEKNNRYIW